MVKRSVRESYDDMAELYASLFLDGLDQDPTARPQLDAFAQLVGSNSGPVADLGCGPGHVVDHLAGLGLAAVGYDLSAGMIEQARKAFPELDFHVADFTALDLATGSLAGIVSRYSLIHLDPARLGDTFAGWHPLLAGGAPLLVSVFAARSAAGHAEPFDHKVAIAHALFPDVIIGDLEAANFTVVEVETVAPPPGGRAFDHCTILAQKSHS